MEEEEKNRIMEEEQRRILEEEQRRTLEAKIVEETTSGLAVMDIEPQKKPGDF